MPNSAVSSLSDSPSLEALELVLYPTSPRARMGAPHERVESTTTSASRWTGNSEEFNVAIGRITEAAGHSSTTFREWAPGRFV